MKTKLLRKLRKGLKIVKIEEYQRDPMYRLWIGDEECTWHATMRMPLLSAHSIIKMRYRQLTRKRTIVWP
jgi:hypothetical protein